MKIALTGAGSYFSLGDSSDYSKVFLQLQEDVLINRLYTKYVKKEDIENTKVALEKAVSKLKGSSLKKIQFILNSFLHLMKCVEYEFEDYNSYVPIRIVLIDSPYRYLEIPLEDYDNLEGDPLWMRPEYVLEKYYPEEKQKRDKEILLQIQESIRKDEENKARQ